MHASNHVPQMHYENSAAEELMGNQVSNPHSNDVPMPETSPEADNEKWLSHIENLESSDAMDQFELVSLANNPQSLEFDLIAATAEPVQAEFEEDDKDSELTTTIEEPYNQQELLYMEASITTAASSVLMMKYVMKHKLSWEALADLLQIVKLHCPSPNNVPSTLFHFKKHFKDLQYPVQHHYFCSTCLSEVSENAKVCGNQECSCSSKESTGSSLSSFIEVPIDLQLKSILERKLIY